MAELHWKQYPYPEENVFLVLGGRVDGGGVDSSTLTPFIIVAHTCEAACKEWLNLSGHKPGYSTLSCASMKQMGDFLALLDEASANPSGYTKAPSVKMAPSGAAREPWLVGIAKSGEDTGSGEVVMASNVQDIEAWCDKKGVSLVSVLPRSGLVASLAEMKKHQEGKVDREYFVADDRDLGDMLEDSRRMSKTERSYYEDMLR